MYCKNKYINTYAYTYVYALAECEICKEYAYNGF